MFLPLIVSPLKRALNIRSMMLVAMIIGAGIFLAACSVQPGTASGQTSAPTGASGGSPSASVSFSVDVQPILQSRCVSCHGGAHTNKGLNMTSYTNVMTTGVDAPVVVAGNPNGSLLIQMVVQGKMPKNGPLLQPGQIQILTDWVKSGAPNN